MRSLLETPRRHTRRSSPNFDPQTLPGTRWDELDIERQREGQRGRVPASDITRTPSLGRLSLHEKRTQVVSQQKTVTSKDPDTVSGRRLTQCSAQKPGFQSVGLSAELIDAGVSPAKRRRPNQPVPAKQQPLLVPRDQPLPLTGIERQSTRVTPKQFIVKDRQSSMARRPGRNQVDPVAELKEAIHESLSKLSEIQEKVTPLGQQIAALEEELKAKESDSSKPSRLFSIRL